MTTFNAANIRKVVSLIGSLKAATISKEIKVQSVSHDVEYEEATIPLDLSPGIWVETAVLAKFDRMMKEVFGPKVTVILTATNKGKPVIECWF